VSVQVAQTSLCEHLFPCVLCRVDKPASFSSEPCADNCTALIIEEVDDLEGEFSYL
jgi:hypothetical protein